MGSIRQRGKHIHPNGLLYKNFLCCEVDSRKRVNLKKVSAGSKEMYVFSVLIRFHGMKWEVGL